MERHNDTAVVHRIRRLTSPVTIVGTLVGQVLHAAHRSDLPSLENQDPSGVFGPEDAPPLRIAILGDSSVTSPGVVPLDDCWVRRLALELADRYRVTVCSVAVGGSKARDVLADQVEAAIATRPDIALISVGANDALRGTPLGHFELQIDQILTRLQEAGIAIGISGVGDLGTIPRLPDLPRRIARIRARIMDRALRRSVLRHPGVLKTDTWGPGWEPFVKGDPAVIFAPDMFHASGVGHGIYADAMRVALDALVEQIDRTR
jgi:lysophospholipase L1-like esterase